MYLDRKNPPPTFDKVLEMERKEGKEEGKLEGKLEGILEEKKSFALKLIHKNFTDKDISDLTELTLDEVKALRKR